MLGLVFFFKKTHPPRLCQASLLALRLGCPKYVLSREVPRHQGGKPGSPLHWLGRVREEGRHVAHLSAGSRKLRTGASWASISQAGFWDAQAHRDGFITQDCPLAGRDEVEGPHSFWNILSVASHSA